MDLKDLRRNWDDLGRKDPLWAILTWPGKRGGRWTADEFFATGAADVEDLMEYLRSLGGTPDSRRALDFGCGVGRVTQALVAHFEEVWGVDIAPSMIEHAREFNWHGDRCKYRLNEEEDLRFLADDTFDLVYSKLTLQHMPPRLAVRFIRELVRVLAPAGVLVFQMAGEPTAARTGLLSAVRRFLKRLVPAGLIRCYRRLRYGHLIDMHGIPRNRIVALLSESGARVLDVQEDTSAGGGWTSFRYCATKP
jgi:SAM-dependent methyltransferase